MRSCRLLVMFVLSVAGAGALLVAVPGVAFAHDELVGSDPADGAVLASAPTRVTLRFDLPVLRGVTVVTVIGPDGGHYESGAAEVDGSSVSAAVAPLGPAGRYRVGYRVVSDDGHPVSGSVAFTMTQAGSGHPVAGAVGAVPPDPGGPATGGGMPIWLWVLTAVVLVWIGLLVVLRPGRD